MQVVQIVLERKLLEAADRAAHRTGQSRSALVRDALRVHLRKLEIRKLKERDREGYLKKPPTAGESRLWEAEAALRFSLGCGAAR